MLGYCNSSHNIITQNSIRNISIFIRLAIILNQKYDFNHSLAEPNYDLNLTWPNYDWRKSGQILRAARHRLKLRSPVSDAFSESFLLNQQKLVHEWHFGRSNTPLTVIKNTKCWDQVIMDLRPHYACILDYRPRYACMRRPNYTWSEQKETPLVLDFEDDWHMCW